MSGRVLALAINTFREAVRNRVLYSLLFFAVNVLVLARVIVRHTLAPCFYRGAVVPLSAVLSADADHAHTLLDRKRS